MLNRRGERAEPWGTPQSRDCRLDLSPIISTDCYQPQRKEEHQGSNVATPNSGSLSRNRFVSLWVCNHIILSHFNEIPSEKNLIKWSFPLVFQIAIPLSSQRGNLSCIFAQRNARSHSPIYLLSNLAENVPSEKKKESKYIGKCTKTFTMKLKLMKNKARWFSF